MDSVTQKVVVARLLAKVRYEENGCWFFTGKKRSGGYGVVKIQRREYLAHRVAYELLRAPIGAGLHLHHLCKNRPCINPDHLQPLTHSEHMRLESTGRDHSRRRPPVRRKPLPQFCKRGHEFTEQNTHVVQRGKYTIRVCRECNNVRMRSYRDETRGAWRKREKKCRHCGTAFLPTAQRQIFCGKRCMWNGTYARERAARMNKNG